MQVRIMENAKAFIVMMKDNGQVPYSKEGRLSLGVLLRETGTDLFTKKSRRYDQLYASAL